MPQIQLPIFPQGVTYITNELAFKREGDEIVYFNGSMPVFVHSAYDVGAFKMITSQFFVTGVASQSEIAKAFGVPIISVKRAVKIYKDEGVSGFFKSRKTRGAAVLTVAVLKRAQDLLGQGIEPKVIAMTLKIKLGTLKKAIQQGRLVQVEKKVFQMI